MGLYRNVAAQKIAVYAHDTAADAPKTGDAANITAQISKDFGAAAATNDVNPTELDATDHPGIYVFDLTQAETEADNLIISAVSGTANIRLDPVQVFTDDQSKYGVVDMGTAQAATGTTLQLRSAAGFADDELNGATILITGGSAGVGQRAIITDYAGATDTATVPTWTTTPTGTITYKIFGSASGMSAADIGDAVRTELTTELALIQAIDDFIDTEIAAILAAVDTEVAAIKTTTDQLTFTVANQLDANVQAVNDVALEGDGSATPWGPA